MRSTNYTLTRDVFLMTIAAILWCEYGYYYYVFLVSCPGWPIRSNDANMTKIMVISDTHIMGRRKSYRIDKLRRHSEMAQSFAISNYIFEPEVIMFLGDILDEGSTAPNVHFEEEIQEFNRIFPHNPMVQDRIIIAGNHDVGYHDRMVMIPYALDRFRSKLLCTGHVNIIPAKENRNLNIIVTNSMSFYNDSCEFCAHSKAISNQLSEHLEQQKRKDPEQFASPILLTHIPLYRRNDEACQYPSSMRDRVKIDNEEGKDTLHKNASEFLLQKFRPRLVLSGHTHMNCEIFHEYPTTKLQKENGKKIREITLTSYNHKYAETLPAFLLITANATTFQTQTCNLVNEYLIASVYVILLIIICYKISRHFKTDYRLLDQTVQFDQVS